MSHEGVTIALAVLAIVLSVLSLTWQLSSFRLSGARLRLNLRLGLYTHMGTLVSWDRRGWPKDPPKKSAVGPDDLWFEVIGISVANLGRTVVWVSGVGLDFTPGRKLRRPNRHRPLSVSLKPLDIDGGCTETGPVRLEPGQSLTMWVAMANALDWASNELANPAQMLVRATALFGGVRTKRSPRRRSWRTSGAPLTYPHLPVTPELVAYREILHVWPSTDISKVYDAWLDASVSLTDPDTHGSIEDALEPYIPNTMTRYLLARNLRDLPPGAVWNRPVVL